MSTVEVFSMGKLDPSEPVEPEESTQELRQWTACGVGQSSACLTIVRNFTVTFQISLLIHLFSTTDITICSFPVA